MTNNGNAGQVQCLWSECKTIFISKFSYEPFLNMLYLIIIIIITQIIITNLIRINSF